MVINISITRKIPEKEFDSDRNLYTFNEILKRLK